MPRKALMKLGNLTFKHTKAGIPDPCIKVRKGSGKVFLNIFFNPTTAFNVEIGTLLKQGKLIPRKESPVKKLRRAPKREVCLFGKMGRKR